MLFFRQNTNDNILIVKKIVIKNSLSFIKIKCYNKDHTKLRMTHVALTQTQHEQDNMVIN